MFYAIALLCPPYNTYTYALPTWWPKEYAHFFCQGLRVAIPLGKTLRVGIIVREGQEQSELDSSVDIKAITAPLEVKPLLSKAYLEFIQQFATRQSRNVGDILGHILPKGLRTAKGQVRSFHSGKSTLINLKKLKDLEQTQAKAIALGLMQDTCHIIPPKTDSALSEICTLQIDPPWPVRPMATKQIAILDYLLEKSSTNRRQLLRHIGQGSAKALESLLQFGYVQLRALQENTTMEENIHTALLPPANKTFTLSTAQQEAINSFSLALDKAQNNNAVHPLGQLLYGITGSGKTAVYLEIVKICHERGLSVLILAPEVALALKLKRDADIALPHIMVIKVQV